MKNETKKQTDTKTEKLVDRLYEENKDKIMKLYARKLRWEKFNSIMNIIAVFMLTWIALDYIRATTSRAKWEGELYKARYIAQSVNNQIGLKKLAEACEIAGAK